MPISGPQEFNLRIIAKAWADILSEFIKSVRGELLLVSPWMTAGVARLISQSIAKTGPIKMQVIARLEEGDFLSGTSHVEAFKKASYPPDMHFEVRALPMLHAKMLVADRRKVIIGSANMTDGGLYRNHEVCLIADSQQLGQQCAAVFFEFWSKASPLPDDYLTKLEATLTLALPNATDEIVSAENRARSSSLKRSTSAQAFKYVKPEGAASARRQIATLLRSEFPADLVPEDAQEAAAWLERQLKFLTKSERADRSIVQRIERLMYHPDSNIRAMAIDRAGRLGNRNFLDRLQSLATNPTEAAQVRSAAAFSLGLLGSAEAFPSLVSLLDETGDIARWARRSCFLLLDVVSAEDQGGFLREVGVTEPASVIQLVRQSCISTGTVSERLTKALVVEKLSTGEWRESHLRSLVCIMIVLTQRIATEEKFSLGTTGRLASKALDVARGDLRHGPLSPALLKRLSRSGFMDPGLVKLLGSIWAEFQGEESAAVAFLGKTPAFHELLDVLRSKDIGRGNT